MSGQQHHSRELPTDIEHVPIVWKYELLKYLRSRRLVGSVAIAALVIVLIFVIPPATGNPYSGTDKAVKISITSAQSIPGFTLPGGVAYLNRSVIVESSLEVFQDGVLYPSGNGTAWTFMRHSVLGQEVNIILFAQNTTGHTYTATYRWHETPEAFASSFVGFANLLIVICATFFGADAIVSEYQARTGYLIFPNPIRRASLYLGKFAASMTASILVIVIFYSVVGILSYVSVSGLDKDFLMSFAFALEYLLAIMAVAYLISTLMKGTTGATVLTFFLFFMILPIIDAVGGVSGFKAFWSVTFSAGVIMSILATPYPTDSFSEMPGSGITFHNYYPDPAVAAIVMLAYALVAMAISMVLFRMKQMTG
jgi:ABC-2 type transport system permease protein